MLQHEYIKSLIAPDATAEVVTQYLEARASDATEAGNPPQALATFWDPVTMWEHLEQARAWWPRSVPPTFSWEQSLAYAASQYAPLTGPQDPGTLVDHLTAAAGRAAAHVVSEGGDPARPNETKAERLARMNRERVARHRERAAGQQSAAVISAEQNLNAMRSQLRHRREEAKAATKAAYDAMVEVSNKGRALVEWCEEQVRAAEQQLDAARKG